MMPYSLPSAVGLLRTQSEAFLKVHLNRINDKLCHDPHRGVEVGIGADAVTVQV